MITWFITEICISIKKASTKAITWLTTEKSSAKWIQLGILGDRRFNYKKGKTTVCMLSSMLVCIEFITFQMTHCWIARLPCFMYLLLFFLSLQRSVRNNPWCIIAGMNKTQAHHTLNNNFTIKIFCARKSRKLIYYSPHSTSYQLQIACRPLAASIIILCFHFFLFVTAHLTPVIWFAFFPFFHISFGILYL